MVRQQPGFGTSQPPAEQEGSVSPPSRRGAALSPLLAGLARGLADRVKPVLLSEISLVALYEAHSISHRALRQVREHQTRSTGWAHLVG